MEQTGKAYHRRKRRRRAHGSRKFIKPISSIFRPLHPAPMNLYQAANPREAATSQPRTAATGLLVSVRSVDEAEQIDRLGVDVIDLKEPARGPLGACDPDIWHRCLAASPFAGEWSAALGEMDSAIPLAAEVPPEFCFAKAGPAGIDRPADLVALWTDLRRRLPTSVALVAVAYADWLAAGTLAPERVLDEAARSGLRTLLIDTFGKDGRSTAEHLTLARLQALVAKADEAGCEVVVAGGVTFESLATLASLGIRRVGVRGGVCEGDRESRIDPAAVARWTNCLARIACGHSEPSS